MSPRVRILGIDPGSRVVGYGVIDFVERRPLCVECGVLRATGPAAVRIAALVVDLGELVEEFDPDEASMELAHVGPFARAALVLSEARGALREELRRRGVPVTEYAPSQAKKVTAGRGNASKERVRTHVMRRLGLASEPRLDASDALALALTHAEMRRRPLIPQLTTGSQQL